MLQNIIRKLFKNFNNFFRLIKILYYICVFLIIIDGALFSFTSPKNDFCFLLLIFGFLIIYLFINTFRKNKDIKFENSNIRICFLILMSTVFAKIFKYTIFKNYLGESVYAVYSNIYEPISNIILYNAYMCIFIMVVYAILIFKYKYFMKILDYRQYLYWENYELDLYLREEKNKKKVIVFSKQLRNKIKNKNKNKR